MAASLRVGTSTASSGERAGPACSRVAKVVWLGNEVPMVVIASLGDRAAGGGCALSLLAKRHLRHLRYTVEPGAHARPKRRTAFRTNPCMWLDAARLVPSMKLIANRPWRVTSAR